MEAALAEPSSSVVQLVLHRLTGVGQLPLTGRGPRP